MASAHGNGHSSQCTFCDIIHGAAEVSVCYEDATAIAFMDIQPVNQGHTLVVSRQHFESFVDLPRDVAMHLFDVATRLGPVIRKVSGAEGMNLIVSSGEAAGQDVYHFHMHLIPRRVGDGFDVPLPFAGGPSTGRTVLDAMAARIISAMRDPVRPSAELARV
jgi:histidine triad (HIT) family protein